MHEHTHNAFPTNLRWQYIHIQIDPHTIEEQILEYNPHYHLVLTAQKSHTPPSVFPHPTKVNSLPSHETGPQQLLRCLVCVLDVFLNGDSSLGVLMCCVRMNSDQICGDKEWKMATIPTKVFSLINATKRVAAQYWVRQTSSTPSHRRARHFLPTSFGLFCQTYRIRLSFWGHLAIFWASLTPGQMGTNGG